MLFKRKPYRREPIFANQGEGGTYDAYNALIDDLTGGLGSRLDARLNAEQERKDECERFFLEARSAYAGAIESGIRSAHVRGKNAMQVKILSGMAKEQARRALEAAEEIAVARYGKRLVSYAKISLGF